jgi:hypothetical protein
MKDTFNLLVLLPMHLPLPVAECSRISYCVHLAGCDFDAVMCDTLPPIILSF